jgi:hypothetical protein
MRHLAILTFLALSPLAAAQNAQPGDVVALSTFSPPGATHGSVSAAINAAGDAYLVWEAAVDAPGSANEGLTRIEGAFLRRTSITTWRIFATEVLGEADPAVLAGDQVYAGGDTCSAPSVAAVDNDFVVAWTRMDAANSSDARIECVTIEIAVTGGAGLVSSAAPGVGFSVTAIDASAAAGQADVLATGGSNFLICYVSNTGVTSYTGGEAYDYELRVIDGAIGIGAPSFGAASVLDDLLAYDNLPGNIPHAAAVEPSCALDSVGNLVVAYSDYRSADRRGFGLDQIGTMELARFEMGSYSLMNSQNLEVRAIKNLQRSANLHHSPSNPTAISLAMTDVDVSGTNQNQIGHYDLDYSGVADATITDHNVGPKSWQPIQAEALQHRGQRFVATDLDFNGNSALAYKRPNRAWIAINPMTSIAPQGLAIGHLETDPANPGNGWAVLLTRGTSGSDARVHFMITRL